MVVVDAVRRCLLVGMLVLLSLLVLVMAMLILMLGGFEVECGSVNGAVLSVLVVVSGWWGC